MAHISTEERLSFKRRTFHMSNLIGINYCNLFSTGKHCRPLYIVKMHWVRRRNQPIELTSFGSTHIAIKFSTWKVQSLKAGPGNLIADQRSTVWFNFCLHSRPSKPLTDLQLCTEQLSMQMNDCDEFFLCFLTDRFFFIHTKDNLCPSFEVWYWQTLQEIRRFVSSPPLFNICYFTAYALLSISWTKSSLVSLLDVHISYLSTAKSSSPSEGKKAIFNPGWRVGGTGGSQSPASRTPFSRLPYVFVPLFPDPALYCVSPVIM